MDCPGAARVVNLSVDLAVVSQAAAGGGGAEVLPVPPIECRLRLTTSNPGTIRLTSVDLGATVLLTKASQVFDYGSDHLGLLRAGLVASGIVSLGLEGSCRRRRAEDGGDDDDGGGGGGDDDVSLGDLLSDMMSTPGDGVDGGGGGGPGGGGGGGVNYN